LEQLDNDQQSISDRQGSLFFVVMSMAMGPMMSCLVAFQTERVVFIREHSTGSYSTLTYYLAKVIADIPFLTIVPIVQGTISYWMVGYQAEADKYFIFIAACICVTLVAHALGLAISAGAPDMNISMAMAPMIFIPLMLLGGFFLSDDSIPKWLMWYVILPPTIIFLARYSTVSPRPTQTTRIKYFSPFKYGFQILARNEFDGLSFTCEPSDQSCVKSTLCKAPLTLCHSCGTES
jgi:ABC-type multidrug transport system permease subunit